MMLPVRYFFFSYGLLNPQPLFVEVPSRTDSAQENRKCDIKKGHVVVWLVFGLVGGGGGGCLVFFSPSNC